MSQQRPRVIYFFMNGCPHCERTWPAWNKVKPKLKAIAMVEERESREVTPDDGVSSFPTFTVRLGDKEIKRIEGARPNPMELFKELGLRRSRSLRRRTYRGKRNLTKRTLRNYKALRK